MIKVALVGTGGMGTVHYHNYAHIDGCEVTALVDVTEKSREKAAEWGLPLYPDIPAMAADQQVDVVDVCTPTFLHKQHVMQALSLGFHAITEHKTIRKNDTATPLVLKQVHNEYKK